MAESVTAKRTVAAKVEQRVRAGVCLICDGEATRRGLCPRHYQLFLRHMRSRGSRTSQAEFEADAIREGLVLAVQQVREIKNDDPFGDL